MLTLANEVVTYIGIAFISLVSFRYLVWLAIHFYAEIRMAIMDVTDKLLAHEGRKLGVRMGDRP